MLSILAIPNDLHAQNQALKRELVKFQYTNKKHTWRSEILHIPGNQAVNIDTQNLIC